MTNGPWARVAAPRASTICKGFVLAAKLRGPLRDDPTPEVFFHHLLMQEEFRAAVLFLAHALPPREAVWWACVCTEVAHEQSLPAEEEHALLAAVRWVLEPIEANRRAAEGPGKALGIISLCGNLALAAFYSHGSINPPDEPIRPASPTQTPDAVARAILRTVDVVYPRCQAIALRQFLAIGEGVALNQDRWPVIQRGDKP